MAGKWRIDKRLWLTEAGKVGDDFLTIWRQK
jgi:hypothetical protein